jgi:hypothetical protein
LLSIYLDFDAGRVNVVGHLKDVDDLVQDLDDVLEKGKLSITIVQLLTSMLPCLNLDNIYDHQVYFIKFHKNELKKRKIIRNLT